MRASRTNATTDTSIYFAFAKRGYLKSLNRARGSSSISAESPIDADLSRGTVCFIFTCKNLVKGAGSETLVTIMDEQSYRQKINWARRFWYKENSVSFKRVGTHVISRVSNLMK